ncbi:chitinase [Trifolium repens]|nr:chitinase [Trifolium repens]
MFIATSSEPACSSQHHQNLLVHCTVSNYETDPNFYVAMCECWDNTDSGSKECRNRGFSSDKLVIGLPYHGFAWTLVKQGEGGVGKPASGAAITLDGSMAYKLIKSCYNDTFVGNYFTIASTNWFNFDDVEVIIEKVSYAKKNGLLGYNVFQVGNDDNWVLSKAEVTSTADLFRKLQWEARL